MSPVVVDPNEEIEDGFVEIRCPEIDEHSDVSIQEAVRNTQ